MPEKAALVSNDDNEPNARIADAENLFEALVEIGDKYGAGITGNEPRYQDGRWLRDLSEFVGDIEAAYERFPKLSSKENGQ